ncbi:hypothetical protein GCM10022251_79040 [Phytohabitans flavus]|uniref:Uncharacterized protein n=1 Tax=Phytohabitans flavus TaxID=1076124 RepID=A0A6F8XLT7_9ACTN|nr:hypothetical protein Pflav_011860 [Phytohabitans flavus]
MGRSPSAVAYRDRPTRPIPTRMVARLNDLPPASGERYDADNMAAIDR